MVVLCTALLWRVTACSGPGNEGVPDDGFDRQALLLSLGENVILPTYRDFEAAADAMASATSAYASALSTGDTEAPTKLQDARETWQAAMDAWQHAELLQVGPAGASTSVTGGEDLRYEIYSWPTISTCRVDQEVVEGNYANADFFDDELVNVYGLDALEYLLFNEDQGNTCAPQVPINDGPWDALSESEKAQKRADYANAVAGNIATRAAQLVNAWEPTGENFLAQLASAGDSGSVYGNAQAALNEVLVALLYIDQTRVKKLEIPSGISTECTTTCPELLESQWARYSKENILANLKAFQWAFHGGDPSEEQVGFDDFLTELGAPDLAQTMGQDVAAAITAIETINGTLRDALVDDLAVVEASYFAVKAITDALRGEFSTVLQLTIPQEGQGDGD